MEAFKVESDATETTIKVRLIGEFDLSAYEEVDQLLTGAQAKSGHDIVVDLRALTFIDSSGIRALLQAALRAEEVGGRLRLIPGPDNVRRVFELLGLDERLNFVDTSEV